MTYDPGWPATVDDAPVSVCRSGDDLVELDLPAGQHRADLWFTGARPDPLGVVLTLAGLWASRLGGAASPPAAWCPRI